jgi:hypothetical protein
MAALLTLPSFFGVRPGGFMARLVCQPRDQSLRLRVAEVESEQLADVPESGGKIGIVPGERDERRQAFRSARCADVVLN